MTPSPLLTLIIWRVTFNSLDHSPDFFTVLFTKKESDTVDPSILKNNPARLKVEIWITCNSYTRDKWNIHEAVFSLLQSTWIYFTMLTYRMSAFSYSVSLRVNQKTLLSMQQDKKARGYKETMIEFPTNWINSISIVITLWSIWEF